MSKYFKYKGNLIERPDNISLNLVKELIDKGGDYGLKVQEIVDIVSKKIGKEEKVLFPAPKGGIN